LLRDEVELAEVGEALDLFLLVELRFMLVADRGEERVQVGVEILGGDSQIPVEEE